MPKKTERGTLRDFSTSIVAKLQKNEGGPFEEKNFRQKSLAMPKIVELLVELFWTLQMYRM